MKTLQQNKDFVRALVEVVDEFGRDYVYPTSGNCVYYKDDYPVCLIAKALAKVGHTKEEIMQTPSQAFFGPNAEKAEIVMTWLGYDPIIARAAQRAQGMQDLDRTWGDATDAFFKELNKLKSVTKFVEFTIRERLSFLD